MGTHQGWKLTVLAGCLVLGCGPRSPAAEPEPDYAGQSYSEALRLICDVDRLAGLDAAADPIEADQRRHDWLSERVKNPDAVYFRVILRTKAGSEQAALLKQESSVAELPGCALAESIADSALF